MKKGNGIDCKCEARSSGECACEADWTPSEVYELRGKVKELEKQNTALQAETETLKRHWIEDDRDITQLEAALEAEKKSHVFPLFGQKQHGEMVEEIRVLNERIKELEAEVVELKKDIPLNAEEIITIEMYKAKKNAEIILLQQENLTLRQKLEVGREGLQYYVSNCPCKRNGACDCLQARNALERMGGDHAK